MLLLYLRQLRKWDPSKSLLYLALGPTEHFNLKLLLKFCNWSSYQVQKIFLAISTSRIFCDQVKETSRRPVGLLITIERVISMTVFLTGTHFLSGRPSLHAPPAAPPRRPDSRIPADNGDKGARCVTEVLLMGGLRTTASSGINTHFWFSCRIINL